MKHSLAIGITGFLLTIPSLVTAQSHSSAFERCIQIQSPWTLCYVYLQDPSSHSQNFLEDQFEGLTPSQAANEGEDMFSQYFQQMYPEHEGNDYGLWAETPAEMLKRRDLYIRTP